MDPIRIALLDFWNGFGVPAYDNTRVITAGKGNKPRTPPQKPYITYNILTPPALTSTMAWANIYDFASNFEMVDAIKKKISDAIPVISGTKLRLPCGSMRLYRGTPFMQDVAEDDPNIRRVYINYELRNLSVWI